MFNYLTGLISLRKTLSFSIWMLPPVRLPYFRHIFNFPNYSFFCSELPAQQSSGGYYFTARYTREAAQI